MSAPPQDQGRADHRSSPADRISRGRVQAQGRLAGRHRAREVRLHPRRPAAAALRRRARHPGAARRSRRAVRLADRHRERAADRAATGRRQRHPRAGRPGRAVRRPGQDPARDLLRGARAPRPGARGRRPARHRHARPRLPAQVAARGHPLDAQGPLPDHGQLHADQGQARPRHDAAHLHHPDQPGLLVRGRHGAEVPGRARLAAGGDRAVRQLAVHRRQAERLPQLPQPRLDRYRSRPLRHPAVRVRGRHGLRALRRARARRADVLRLPRRRVY